MNISELSNTFTMNSLVHKLALICIFAQLVSCTVTIGLIICCLTVHKGAENTRGFADCSKPILFSISVLLLMIVKLVVTCACVWGFIVRSFYYMTTWMAFQVVFIIYSAFQAYYAVDKKLPTEVGEMVLEVCSYSMERTALADFTTSANTDSMDMDSEVGFSDSLLTFAAVMTFTIMIVGIIGNFLTVAALIKCPKVRNVAAAFIISLCVADLLFCALVLPFMGLRFVQGTWKHGAVLCRVIPFIQYGNIGVSLLCIGMITINRYVMIAHHSLYNKLYKRHWIAAMIAFCWIFAYGMQVPTLCGAWGKFDYDPKLGTCSIMTDRHGRSSKTTLFITAFVIPCIIIIACYAKIFWVVHQSEMRLKEHANKQNSIPNNLRQTPRPSVDNTQSRISSNMASDSSYSTDTKPEIAQKPSQVKDQREARAKRNEWRITKMVLAIFLSFVICYLPITIAKVADKDVEYPVFHIFSYILLYLSACINPIIYVIMNKQYRKAYKTVIMCEPSKFLPFTKPNVNSSAAEKWNDTALSNNHSRTIVSQMSGPDQQSISLSSSQQPPFALEMTDKTNLKNPSINVTPTERMADKKDPENNLKPKSNNGEMPQVTTIAIRLNTPPVRATHQIITLGNDIILEEEEEEIPQVSHQGTTTANESLAENAENPPKKNPFYGQNINDIPDNIPKLSTKLKI